MCYNQFASGAGVILISHTYYFLWNALKEDELNVFEFFDSIPISVIFYFSKIFCKTNSKTIVNLTGHHRFWKPVVCGNRSIVVFAYKHPQDQFAIITPS
jgi:hypothetical protein